MTNIELELLNYLKDYSSSTAKQIKALEDPFFLGLLPFHIDKESRETVHEFLINKQKKKDSLAEKNILGPMLRYLVIAPDKKPEGFELLSKARNRLKEFTKGKNARWYLDQSSDMILKSYSTSDCTYPPYIVRIDEYLRQVLEENELERIEGLGYINNQ